VQRLSLAGDGGKTVGIAEYLLRLTLRVRRA
jgi:hypothetical protein